MIHRIKRLHKASGITYIYEGESFWCKDTKRPRNKRVCIGKLCPTTGEFIPSKRLNPTQAAVRDPAVVASVEVCGPILILETIAQRIKLVETLKACLPDEYRHVLTMAYYLTCRGEALSSCSSWCRNHAPDIADTLSSQRVSDLLVQIGTAKKQEFLSRWMRKVLEDDYLFYDITSVSSYASFNEYIKYGHNRDLEKLPQINLGVLCGQKSQLPVYFERFPGNITDVTTLHNIIKTFQKLEIKGIHYVMDRGFFSKDNVDALFAAKDKFVISVPLNNKWLQEAIDDVYETMHAPQRYKKFDTEAVYVHSRIHYWNKARKRCYLHLYYNAHIRVSAIDRFHEQLQLCKEELEIGTLVKEHQDFYDKFFIVKKRKGTNKISYNDVLIMKYINRYLGFQAILTNSIKDPLEALRTYRDKDAAEKCFYELKNQLDMKRLRMHSSATVDGRLFVQFISLICSAALRSEMRKTKLAKRYTVRELLQEMDTLSRIKYSGKYGNILTEITKPQREILKTMRIEAV